MLQYLCIIKFFRKNGTEESIQVNFVQKHITSLHIILTVYDAYNFVKCLMRNLKMIYCND